MDMGLIMGMGNGHENSDLQHEPYGVDSLYGGVVDHDPVVHPDEGHDDTNQEGEDGALPRGLRPVEAHAHLGRLGESPGEVG